MFIIRSSLYLLINNDSVIYCATSEPFLLHINRMPISNEVSLLNIHTGLHRSMHPPIMSDPPYIHFQRSLAITTRYTYSSSIPGCHFLLLYTLYLYYTIYSTLPFTALPSFITVLPFAKGPPFYKLGHL